MKYKIWFQQVNAFVCEVEARSEDLAIRKAVRDHGRVQLVPIAIEDEAGKQVNLEEK